jgi:hypothetical protein
MYSAIGIRFCHTFPKRTCIRTTGKTQCQCLRLEVPYSQLISVRNMSGEMAH